MRKAGFRAQSVLIHNVDAEIQAPVGRSSSEIVCGLTLLPNDEDALAEPVAEERVECARQAYHEPVPEPDLSPVWLRRAQQQPVPEHGEQPDAVQIACSANPHALGADGQQTRPVL